MRRFLILHDDRPAELVDLPIHPCEDLPPVVVVPAVMGADPDNPGEPVEIYPAVVNDPEPYYRGPPDNVVEITDDMDAETRAHWERFTGLSVAREYAPEAFDPPSKADRKASTVKRPGKSTVTQ